MWLEISLVFVFTFLGTTLAIGFCKCCCDCEVVYPEAPVATGVAVQQPLDVIVGIAQEPHNVVLGVGQEPAEAVQQPVVEEQPIEVVVDRAPEGEIEFEPVVYRL